MGYRKTEHKNALTKLVKEKKMILQTDAADRLNKDSINSTAKVLAEQGKFKRQKVKVRGKVGNLTDQYLLYSNDIKQAEILEYEKELINRPFESPLKKNHCYKKIEDPVEQELKLIVPEIIEDGNIEEGIVNNNVIDIQEYIKVNNHDLLIKEYKGERIVTFKEIDAVHQRPNGTASRNFKNNRERFIEDVDYFIVGKNQKDDIRPLDIPNRGLTLITETGYMMLVKSFTDDLSWEVQRQLVKSYFKIKELKEIQNNNLPIVQKDLKFDGIYDIIKMFAGGITDLNDRVKLLENTIEGFKKAVTGWYIGLRSSLNRIF